MTDLQTDLQLRWKPTRDQDSAAAAVLRDTDLKYVYTAHMLKHKRYGIWTQDVEVVQLTPNVFASREEVLRFLEGAAAGARAVAHRALFTTGYTVHSRAVTGITPTSAGQSWSCEWAVFEDILSTSEKEV